MNSLVLFLCALFVVYLVFSSWLRHMEKTRLRNAKSVASPEKLLTLAIDFDLHFLATHLLSKMIALKIRPISKATSGTRTLRPESLLRHPPPLEPKRRTDILKWHWTRSIKNGSFSGKMICITTRYSSACLNLSSIWQCKKTTALQIYIPSVIIYCKREVHVFSV